MRIKEKEASKLENLWEFFEAGRFIFPFSTLPNKTRTFKPKLKNQKSQAPYRAYILSR